MGVCVTISDKAGQTTGAKTLIHNVGIGLDTGINLDTGIKYLALHKETLSFIVLYPFLPFSVQDHSSITQFKHLVVFFAEHLHQIQTLEQSIHLVLF